MLRAGAWSNFQPRKLPFLAISIMENGLTYVV